MNNIVSCEEGGVMWGGRLMWGGGVMWRGRGRGLWGEVMLRRVSCGGGVMWGRVIGEVHGERGHMGGAMWEGPHGRGHMGGVVWGDIKVYHKGYPLSASLQCDSIKAPWNYKL